MCNRDEIFNASSVEEEGITLPLQWYIYCEWSFFCREIRKEGRRSKSAQRQEPIIMGSCQRSFITSAFFFFALFPAGVERVLLWAIFDVFNVMPLSPRIGHLF